MILYDKKRDFFLEKLLQIFNAKFNLIIKGKTSKKNYKEVFWKIHRIHWEKNRFLFDLYYIKKLITLKKYNYMINLKVVDSHLHSLWRISGFEIICSSIALGKNQFTLKNNSVCRVPILIRLKSATIKPDNSIGCISCVSGDGLNGKPIWWNTKFKNN